MSPEDPMAKLPTTSPKRPRLRALAAVAALTSIASAASPAEAAPCADLPNPVYVTGGGRVFLESLGKVLGPQGTTVVYLLQGSCLAVNAILSGTKITGPAVYWNATSELTCELDPAGQNADLGISSVFPSTCLSLPSGLPAGVSDIQGPVEAHVFVVPEASTQRTISMEAAYFVFGFGVASGVAPWDDETQMFRRDPNSGTQQMMGLAIGVPPEKWKGTDAGASSGVVMGLSMTATPEKAIGILTTQIANEQELLVNPLAYQAHEQTCAYWPDSTAVARDKRNVRDGHYAIWGPTHLLTRVNANGFPLSAGADTLINYITSTQEIISLLATTGLVPQCAMRVRRTSELGPLASFAPDQSCSCFYESVAIGKTSCQSCTSSVECPSDAPRCNYGFCEVQ